MSKLRVHCFAISLDGYGAGPHQDLANPIGVGGIALHEWLFARRTFQRIHGRGGGGGATGIDDDFAARGFENIGAWIIGRNTFGPIRGPWPDDSWKGWWGDNPPYHTDVFVLTHCPRASISMNGETTFHFVTEGIRAALQRGRQESRRPSWRRCGVNSAIYAGGTSRRDSRDALAGSPRLWRAAFRRR